MIGRRRRDKRTHTTPEITLTPLIDTALVLLVIFMVAAPIVHNAIKVDLPKGQRKEADAKHEDIIVYLDKNEQMYLGKEPITKDVLIEALRQKVSRDDQVVFIQADRSVSYGTVAELAGFIKDGGVTHVALATQKGTATKT